MADWVKLSIPDYRRLQRAAHVAERMVIPTTFGPVATSLPSDARMNWRVVPEPEAPYSKLRIYGGFLVVNDRPFFIPTAVNAKTPPHSPWYPDPWPSLGTPVPENRGVDYWIVDLPSMAAEERELRDGTLGFVYWASKLNHTDDVLPWPGRAQLAVSEAAMRSAFASHPMCRILATVSWDNESEYHYRIRQTEFCPIVVSPNRPWDVVFDDDTPTLAIFRDCAMQTAGVSLFYDQLTYEMPDADVAYISAKINTQTKEASIVASEVRSDVAVSTVPEGTEYVHCLLYRALRLGGMWFVVTDYRWMLRGMIYG